MVPSWKKLFQSGQRNAQNETSARPNVEQLEDRMVPTVLDLTSAGAVGALNGGVFRQFDQQPAGSGVLQSFVRLQAGGNATTEQGFNTDARPLRFNENNSPTFTHSLPLSSVPVVTLNGVKYRQFTLDINQNGANPLVSLDQLRLFVGNRGDLTDLGNAVKVYDMGAGNWVALDARLSHGSGQSDMVFYVHDSVFNGFAPNSFVYLYSQFGVHIPCNGGYEEWATSQAAPFTLQTFTISGFVTDLARVSPAYTVTLTNLTTGATQTFTSSSSSGYAFSGLNEFDNYTVVITSPGNLTTPASYEFDNLTADQIANFLVTDGGRTGS